MMHDVLERFRYRFQLWHRERREDLLGIPRTGTPEERDYLSDYSDPKRAVLLTESTVRSICRSGVAYLGIIAIAAQICLFLARRFPSARSAIGIIFLVFVGFWTVG